MEERAETWVTLALPKREKMESTDGKVSASVLVWDMGIWECSWWKWWCGLLALEASVVGGDTGVPCANV